MITGLKEKCRERITNGLRSFIASDNYNAVEVGHLRRGQRPFKVVRPKMSGDCSDVLGEGADDLTSGAEEFDTLKACINVDHIDKQIGDRPWSMQIGTHFFAKQFTKEFEGSEWEELYHHYEI